ncbi:MAG: hypothetical protein K0S33_2765 [Bacteroidetes bacterium]|jgi:hypothetical protein|nr:hypothetical protein [Bacteroidota bacterium]
MEKLKKTIQQLDTDNFAAFEAMLLKNKSDKFLFLTKAYRTKEVPDTDLQDSLDCTGNALYVLKSRLYDKVQKFLIDNKTSDKTVVSDKKTESYDQYLYEFPRETAIAMLLELESKCLTNDYTNDLINIYSALKKAHSYSDKYYVYSQLYNKQVAYMIALEKAEDVLFNFNRTLANYFFSDSLTDLEMMGILKKEIRNIFALNKSHRIELILNTIIIQSQLFAGIGMDEEEPLEDLIERNETIVEQHASDYRISKYRQVNAFFRFEYYIKINQFKKAVPCYEEVTKDTKSWLLMNNTCLAFKFLLTKVDFLVKSGRKEELPEGMEEMVFDRGDFYTSVVYSFHRGIALYFNGKIKESVTALNAILNEISLVNFFFIELEIKLALAFIYYKQTEYDLADNLLKSMSRKISGEKKSGYNNTKTFIKILGLKMGKSDAAALAKVSAAIEQLDFYNTRERKILEYLGSEITMLGKSK